MFAGIMMMALVLAAGCSTDGGGKNRPSGEQTWLEIHGDEIVDYPYTKADIEAYIDTHWQEYGYGAKPTKYIALSFDDGPCPPSQNGGTAAMLAALEAARVKATFFVTGSNVRANKAEAKAILDAGHELGNHSNTHNYLGKAAPGAIAADLDAASQAIKDISGTYPRFFRAPFLDHGVNLSQVCRERGMTLIDGNGHNDWPGSQDAIRGSVLANPQDGGIILLHENNTSQGNTMAVLPDIVGGLREQGFWIMSVGELAAVKGKTLEAGVRYGAIR